MIRAQTQAQALSPHSYNPGSEETYKNDSPRNNAWSAQYNPPVPLPNAL